VIVCNSFCLHKKPPASGDKKLVANKHVMYI